MERDRLSEEERRLLEEHEARVVWEPLLDFGGEPRLDPDRKDTDDGPPYATGPSLIDRERIAHLKIDHSYQWSGAVRFRVSDGDREIDFMLHARHVETLMDALQHWQDGGVHGWLAKRWEK